MKSNEKLAKIPFKFASVSDNWLVDTIIKPTENEARGQKWVEQGTDNKYPTYLYDLYLNVPILQTIINGICDYAVGDGVKSNILNLSDTEAEKLVREMAFSYAVFGGFYLNVLRNRLGMVAKIHCLDSRNVRTDKKNEWFYYSEDYAKKTYGRGKYVSLPKFNIETKDVPSSIFYHKNSNYNVYAQPIWGSATIAAETLKEVLTYNFNSIKNGLSSNFIISFLNGQPTEEVQEAIEEAVYEKFTGSENAGRPMLNWASDKDHAIQVDKIDADNFADRFTALQKSAEQSIFTAFRCNPNLFGINTENNGFAMEQFADSYKLFSATVIRPLQKIICNALNDIFGTDNAITISPFTVDFSEEATNDNVVN